MELLEEGGGEVTRARVAAHADVYNRPNDFLARLVASNLYFHAAVLLPVEDLVGYSEDMVVAIVVRATSTFARSKPGRAPGDAAHMLRCRFGLGLGFRCGLMFGLRCGFLMFLGYGLLMLGLGFGLMLMLRSVVRRLVTGLDRRGDGGDRVHGRGSRRRRGNSEQGKPKEGEGADVEQHVV